jgi:glycosyltransferase involved in cell wall biosynthesis
MRIALLSWESLHSIRVGGIAPHVSELAAALERRGHDIHVFTRIGEGQSRYELIDGVHYHRCPFQPDSDFVTSMGHMSDSFAWHLGEVEAECGQPFDIVHGHDWLVAKALCQIKNERHRPVVLTVHSTEYGRCGNELFWHCQSQHIREIEWEATYIANRVICVSQSLRKEVQWLYTVPSDKIVSIYNGVDVRPFDAQVNVKSIRARHAIGVDDPCVLFAGRLAWQKGPDLLVEAMPRVLREHPKAKFVFAGEGDMLAELETCVGAARSTPAARFVGYRKGAELIGLFKSADVVCVPSRNEPFGIVILEAWSASKPVVATRTGGPAEFVRHEDTGFTVASDAKSIGDGVGEMLSDMPGARRMGINGRREAETRFSWENIAAQTEAVYLLAS